MHPLWYVDAPLGVGGCTPWVWMGNISGGRSMHHLGDTWMHPLGVGGCSLGGRWMHPLGNKWMYPLGVRGCTLCG